MADKTMLNFRCPADLLDAINELGQERYPTEGNKHGCDRSKTLLDIVRAGIEALSDGLIVLPVLDNNVRHCKTSDVIDIEGRFAAIEQRLRKIEGLSDGKHQSFSQELQQELEVARADNQRLRIELGNLHETEERELSQLRSQLEIERAEREKFEAELFALNAKLVAALEQNEKSAPIPIAVELRSQLEQERADHQEIQAELFELKQNLAPATTLSENLTPDLAMVLNQVRAKRKKLKIDLEDLKAILKILATSAKKIEDER